MLTCMYYLSNSFANKKIIYGLDNANNMLVLKQIGDNPVEEARGHFKNFNWLFFTLSPDGRQIQDNIRQAMNLADKSAEAYYNTFKENHYYNKLIASNISQSLEIDSISINTDHPYRVTLYGKLLLVRPSMTIERSIITTGLLRRTQRSKNNPHGFIIEHFKIIEIKDLRTLWTNKKRSYYNTLSRQEH